MASYNPILDKNGVVTKIVKFAADVTSRKQAEEELREKANLLDLSHDTIMMRDLSGKILFWNKGAEEMYGYSKEQALGGISHTLLGTIFPKPLADIEAEFLKKNAGKENWSTPFKTVRASWWPAVGYCSGMGMGFLSR